MARTLTAADVRAAIAAGMLLEESNAALGHFSLRSGQRGTVARTASAVDRFGGALLCDPPGSGKTIVALAVARKYASPSVPALVLAPAALREQWVRSAREADAPVEFRSLESVSRGTALPRASLVIVDEAHRLGASGTARHTRIAELATRTPVLLLTATPVVNRLADRDRLLQLFLGSRTDVSVEDVVIRDARGAESVPDVQRLPPLDAAVHVPGLDRALRGLPPPFPVADGRAATALVVSTLAFAWRSSLAALSHALARRESRGRALEDELEAGRWPNRETLRKWIVGDEPTQLTFSFGLTAGEQAPPIEALPTLRRHLDDVRSLRALVGPLVKADSAQRAAALLELLRTYAPARAVCFAHHAETVRALWSELRQTPGVVAITGERVRAAAGRWSRDEVLAALGPRYKPWRADDPRGIRLLVTTDLLSEGVELPGVEVVVHGDGAWTPARLEQRVGRVRRPSSRARVVLVTGFSAPAGSGGLLKLAARLRAKRLARREALDAAESSDQLRKEVSKWRPANDTTAPHSRVGPIVAAVSHDQRAMLALIEDRGESELLNACVRRGRWRVSNDPRESFALAKVAANREVEIDTDFASIAHRLIERVLARRSARKTVGATPAPGFQTHRALRRTLSAAIETTSLAHRTAVAERAQQLLSSIARTRTHRTDRELRELLRSGLQGTALFDALEAVTRTWLTRTQNEPRDSARLVALLLFQPDASFATTDRPSQSPAPRDPPPASPESAATR